MATVNGAIRQQVGIMNGGRGHGSSQDKSVIGINRGMFLKPKMGDIVFDSPV